MRIQKLALGAALMLAAGAAATTGAVSAVQAQNVKIGTILSVTGRAAFLGEDMKRGMEIAVEEINAAGGVLGKKLEWVFYDTESQSVKGVNAVKRLLSQDKVSMIVGGGSMSGIALAVMPMTERAKIPFISTEGSMQIVSPVAKRPFTFKSTADDDQAVSRALDYLKKKGVKKVALLHSTTGFGQSALVQTKKVAPKYGVDVVYEAFGPADTDLTPQLTRIKDSGAQAVIIWTVTPAGVVALKQMQQLGMQNLHRVHSYGFVSQRYMKLAGTSAKGLLLISVKFPVGEDLPDSDKAKKQILTLKAKYKKKYGREPNQFVAQTYDAVHLARLAIEKAKSTDPAKVRDALRTIQNHEGASGTFNFSKSRHSGLSKSDLVLVKWEDGRFKLADY